MENEKANLKLPFKFPQSHHCSAGVVHCEDFRFWHQLHEFLKTKYDLDFFDLVSLAGGGGAVVACNLDNPEDITTKSINVPFALHGADTLIVFNHRDCGAFGGSAKFNQNHDQEQAFHFDQLRQAKTKLSQKYPDKTIITVYADIIYLDDEKADIEFIVLE